MIHTDEATLAQPAIDGFELCDEPKCDRFARPHSVVAGLRLRFVRRCGVYQDGPVH